MKTLSLALLTILALAPTALHAQPRGQAAGPQTPKVSAAMKKLFGDNKAFTANMEMQMKGASGDLTGMSGKMAYDEGKSRFEMDLASMKSREMSPGMVEQMKTMGMDKMVSISRPDKKADYIVYPGLKAYSETPSQDPDSAKPASDFKVEITELGKETVDGHPCVKNKAVITDNQGQKHEYTVWNATDLKNFPIKTETTQQGGVATSTFKDVKFDRPAASEFEPPSDFTRYNSMMEMMQAEMMKRMGGMGTGMPPGRR